MEPRNRFQGIDSASLCSLAARYENPIPTWFLAPIDCSKIPAQEPWATICQRPRVDLNPQSRLYPQVRELRIWHQVLLKPHFKTYCLIHRPIKFGGKSSRVQPSVGDHSFGTIQWGRICCTWQEGPALTLQCELSTSLASSLPRSEVRTTPNWLAQLYVNTTCSQRRRHFALVSILLISQWVQGSIL